MTLDALFPGPRASPPPPKKKGLAVLRHRSKIRHGGSKIPKGREVESLANGSALDAANAGILMGAPVGALHQIFFFGVRQARIGM